MTKKGMNSDPLDTARGFVHGILLGILGWILIIGLFLLVGCSDVTIVQPTRVPTVDTTPEPEPIPETFQFPEVPVPAPPVEFPEREEDEEPELETYSLPPAEPQRGKSCDHRGRGVPPHCQ